MTVRLLAMSGSLRSGSYNTQLLRAVARALPPGWELERYGDMHVIPAYNEDDEAVPPLAVRRLKDALVAADALVVATPEYNASVPGALKNALDWVSRPLAASPVRGLPTLVVGASTSLFGAVWAQAELRRVLSAMGADVLDDELPVAFAADAFAPAGDLGDDDLDGRLRVLVGELTARVASSSVA